MQVTEIIVGQGLCGSLLALELLRRGRRILVYEASYAWSASRAAAGLYHPLSGRGLLPVWQAEKLFPATTHYYRALAKELGLDDLVRDDLPLYRPFVSKTEAKHGRQAIHTHPYISNIGIPPSKDLPAPYEGMYVQQAGRLNVEKLLEGVRAKLQQVGAFRPEVFAIDSVSLPAGGGIYYQGIQAERLILCQGAIGNQNSFFSTLPLRPLAGEWLEGTLKRPLPCILNRKGYVLPLSTNKHPTHQYPIRIGATYERLHSVPDRGIYPSNKGQQALMRTYERLCNWAFRPSQAGAGIRSTSPDRRPWIGSHPKHKAVVICNGLGTRGVSLAPSITKALVQHLMDGTPIATETNLLRKHGLADDT